MANQRITWWRRRRVTEWATDAVPGKVSAIRAYDSGGHQLDERGLGGDLVVPSEF